MRKLHFLPLFLCGLLMMSCQDDFGGIDDDLSKAIKAQSPDGTIDYYILPDSDSYNQIPQDPKNSITDEKVLLGQLLFHETGLGEIPKDIRGSRTYSCASCHQSEAGFQSGNVQGIGEGGVGFGSNGERRRMDMEYEEALVDVQAIRSPTVLNSAYQTNMLWNGQFGATHVNEGTESQWTEDTPKAENKLGFQGIETQAIAGLGVHRLKVDEDLVTALGYKPLFDQAFSDVSVSERYTPITAGMALAAYERTLLTTEAPFQRWLKGDDMAMDVFAKKGAIIFFDKAGCATCHNGPALSSMEFHAYGMSDLSDSGEHIVNRNSNAVENLGRGGFTKNDSDNYKFKVPQLYNLAHLDFLGHGSSFRSLRELIEYKNKGVKQNQNVPDNMLSPHFKSLDLDEGEMNRLIYFIETSLYDGSINRYVPSELPSGNCFPNADIESKQDMGCE